MSGQLMARAHRLPDPVFLTKTWLNPAEAHVIMEPLSAFGEKVVNDKFGDKVTITRVNKMPSKSESRKSRHDTLEARDAERVRKSSRSPINPLELYDKRSTKERRGSHGSCASHNGTTPRLQKRALDILNLPGAVGSSRSPSPAERRRNKSGQSGKSEQSGKDRSKSRNSHHILDDCDSDKWSKKTKSSRREISPVRQNASPRPQRPSRESKDESRTPRASSRKESERYKHYDVDRRSPMPPRKSPRKGRSQRDEESERDGSRERVPSARSRRLYRDEFYYSDGFTESASSEDWPTPSKKNIKKRKELEKKAKKDRAEEEVCKVVEKKSKIKGLQNGVLKAAKAAQAFESFASKSSRKPEQEEPQGGKDGLKNTLNAVIALESTSSKGARKPEAEDPWGGNSPMRRIERIEASFGPDQEGPMDHELEEEILQEAEEAELHMVNSSATETEAEDAGGEKPEEPELKTTEHTLIVSPPDTEYELPVFNNVMSNAFQGLLQKAELEQDKDSCIGLSIDRSSAPSTEPPNPPAAIEAAFAMALQDPGSGRFVFEPLPLMQVVGKMRDIETGQTFDVYTDGDPPAAEDFDGVSMESDKSEDEEDSVSWCSVYLFIRAIGCVCVMAFLGGLVLLSLYGTYGHRPLSDKS